MCSLCNNIFSSSTKKNLRQIRVSIKKKFAFFFSRRRNSVSSETDQWSSSFYIARVGRNTTRESEQTRWNFPGRTLWHKKLTLQNDLTSLVKWVRKGRACASERNWAVVQRERYAEALLKVSRNFRPFSCSAATLLRCGSWNRGRKKIHKNKEKDVNVANIRVSDSFRWNNPKMPGDPTNKCIVWLIYFRETNCNSVRERVCVSVCMCVYVCERNKKASLHQNY